MNEQIAGLKVAVQEEVSTTRRELRSVKDDQLQIKGQMDDQGKALVIVRNEVEGMKKGVAQMVKEMVQEATKEHFS